MGQGKQSYRGGGQIVENVLNHPGEIGLKLYRGKDCVKKFCEHVIGEARCLYRSFPEKPMDPLTKAQLKRYEEVRICHICFKLFNGENPKVRDHSHYTSCYRGPSYMKCNL